VNEHLLNVLRMIHQHDPLDGDPDLHQVAVAREALNHAEIVAGEKREILPG